MRLWALITILGIYPATVFADSVSLSPQRIRAVIENSDLRYHDLITYKSDVDEWISRLDPATRSLVQTFTASYVRDDFHFSWEEPRSATLDMTEMDQRSPALDSLLDLPISHFVRFTVADRDKAPELDVLIGFDADHGGRSVYVVTSEGFDVFSTDPADDLDLATNPGSVLAEPLVVLASATLPTRRLWPMVRAGCESLLRRGARP